MLDLHDLFGIDTLDPVVQRRPWWWLRAHITGLLDKDTRLLRLFMKEIEGRTA